MQYAPIIELAEWADDDFSARCARSSVTRNKSRQDRTGWDHVVEFAAREVAGVPADLQPVETATNVKVKSKPKGRPFIDFKLSNALHFAKNAAPCFLALYQATEGGEPVFVFVVN